MVCPLYLLLSINNPKGGHSWKEKFNSFAEFYATDLPNFTTLDGESELWERYLQPKMKHFLIMFLQLLIIEQLVCVMKNQATCDHRVVHVKILNPRHADEP